MVDARPACQPASAIAALQYTRMWHGPHLPASQCAVRAVARGPSASHMCRPDSKGRTAPAHYLHTQTAPSPPNILRSWPRKRVMYLHDYPHSCLVMVTSMTWTSRMRVHARGINLSIRESSSDIHVFPCVLVERTCLIMQPKGHLQEPTGAEPWEADDEDCRDGPDRQKAPFGIAQHAAHGHHQDK